ncbi:MAG: hypothetical protein KKF12_18515 [Proteobacteria bacterium]|nr:hypothetical protein [Desulfobacula sp.]MBU3952966.1 hypothetical protein [Pseudomonadota bacterium]MBU4132815.1 hypothetical protein [Pseudomonadota bacterium]
MYHHTQTQKEWLKKADPEDIKLFLSKGPATCDMALMTPSMKTKYIPMIRGMHLGGTFDLPEQAIKKARTVLGDIQKQVNGKTPLDEQALGIDGQNAAYLAQCDENELRISDIFHLASVLGSDEMEYSFHEPIDDFVEYLFSKTDHHASILPLIPKVPDENDIVFLKECLHEHWLKNGLFGFAILATTPVCDDIKMSSGWRYCHQKWFYAETYAWAFDLAMEWAKKEGA